MTTLAALGIKSSMPTPNPSVNENAHGWTKHNGGRFEPTIGKCYEVQFGKVAEKGKERLLSARIRIDGELPSEWFNLDTNSLLEWGLSIYIVQVSREISCPNGNTPCTGAQEGAPADR